MGVLNLWSILDTVVEEKPLTYLENKTVAVDLSIWIVQSKQQKGLNESKKPHLKNLFYRLKYLLTHKVNPIFVLDGKPPKLKEATIKNRNIKFFSKFHEERYDGGSGQRENFMECMDECADLLDSLGVPYIRSKGEAESLCAYLNAKGIVEGCITEDNDAFLYGAETVIRDFSIQSKEIKVYGMKRITEELHLNRKKLIVFALILGSDYNRGGIAGLGKENALSFLHEIGDVDILQRLDEYKTKTESELFPNYSREKDKKMPSHCIRCQHYGTKTEHKTEGCDLCNRKTSCLKQNKCSCSCDWHENQREKEKIKYELKFYDKVHNLDGFPDKEVLDEYLISSRDNHYSNNIPDKKDLVWKRPNLTTFQEKAPQWFGYRENIIKSLLQLVTTWQITNIIGKKISPDSPEIIYQPIKIVKEKTEQRKKLFVVEWHKKDSENLTVDLCTDEPVDDFSEAYVNITKEYRKRIAEEKKSPNKRTSSPIKMKPSDLLKNHQIKDYFPIKKKRAHETRELEVEAKLKAL